MDNPVKNSLRNEEYLFHLFDNLEFDCWAMNSERIYVFQNQKSIENWKDVTGLSLEQLQIPNELKRKWSSQLDRVYSGEKIETEYYSETVNRHLKSIITPIIVMGQVEGVIGVTIDITSIKNNEIALEEKNRKLEELNTALHVLLDRRESDRRKIMEETAADLLRNITPYLERLKLSLDNSRQNLYLQKIEAVFSNVLMDSPLCYLHQLSPMEGIIADSIKEGLSSKEIAFKHHISKSTVDSHRNNIRKKLGIKKTGQSLKHYFKNNK